MEKEFNIYEAHVKVNNLLDSVEDNETLKLASSHLAMDGVRVWMDAILEAYEKLCERLPSPFVE